MTKVKKMESSSQSPPRTNTIQPYRMHVSQKYLDLTKKKLELTRLPRDPRNAQQQQQMDAGVSKNELEPLVDHWVENYQWRAQEQFYNDALPQFRVPINNTRLHFVHKRSQAKNALPLLIVHGWPESFIAAAKIIDALSNPISTPPHGEEDIQAFHVVVPSVPGFGFSDPIPEAANNMQATAEVFNTLMRGLGYHQYMCHGIGWGFKICRLLALTHPSNCIAIHTANPDIPAPRSTFGYTPDELMLSVSMAESSQMPFTTGIAPAFDPLAITPSPERPQTTAYALCDSPSGLLAYILDSIRPPKPSPPTSSSGSPYSLLVPTPGRSPMSQPTYTPQTGRSPMSQSAYTPQPAHSPRSTSGAPSPQALELHDVSSPWSPTAILNWTMLYWLPGPEVALRWLTNSSNLTPLLWASYSAVPLGITHFREASSFDASEGSSPPQWAEAYHRLAMIRRREGRVRFAAWEAPSELVLDIREFAGILGLGPSGPFAPGAFS